MGMRDMYAYAIQTAKGKFHGNAEERDASGEYRDGDGGRAVIAWQVTIM